MEFMLVRRFLGIMMLLHLLVSQNVMYTEGALCETPSSTFRGLCFISRNCILVCEKEGFTSGRCLGFRHRCICGKDCTGTPGVPPGGGGEGGGGGGEDPGTPPGGGGDGGEDPGAPPGGGGEGGEDPDAPPGNGGERGEDPDTPSGPPESKSSSNQRG